MYQEDHIQMLRARLAVLQAQKDALKLRAQELQKYVIQVPAMIDSARQDAKEGKEAYFNYEKYMHLRRPL